MNCIIVDDEPVARKGMKSLVEQHGYALGVYRGEVI